MQDWGSRGPGLATPALGDSVVVVVVVVGGDERVEIVALGDSVGMVDVNKGQPHWAPVWPPQRLITGQLMRGRRRGAERRWLLWKAWKDHKVRERTGRTAGKTEIIEWRRGGNVNGRGVASHVWPWLQPRTFRVWSRMSFWSLHPIYMSFLNHVCDVGVFVTCANNLSKEM